MAFSTNGNGSRGRGRFQHGGAISEINVTPFVDVLLVLLIIFMLTAHVMESGIEIDVPTVKTTKETTKDLPIVSLTKAGQTYLGENPININELSATVLKRWGTGQTVYVIAGSGEVNQVANDTESQVPQAPPQPKPVEKIKEPPPDAIPLKGRDAKKTSRVTTNPEKYRPYTEPRPNQVYSSTGSAMVSPMMGTPGSGGVGIGKGMPLGDRFGWYAALLQQRIAQAWNTQDVDPRIKTAPPVVMNFTIMR